MSYEIGIKTLRLELTERLAHTEYCSNYALVRALTGLDPQTDGNAWKAFYDAWDIDFLWVTNDGPVSWGKRGRITDMGHAEFLEGGIDWRDTVYCPFKEVEEVLSFEAVEEYGLPNQDELISYYERVYQNGQRSHPKQVYPGGYYKTIVSGLIQTFGTKDEIRVEIDATLELAKDCPGFMFAVGNHIPSNVPLENALFYFDYLKKHWNR